MLAALLEIREQRQRVAPAGIVERVIRRAPRKHDTMRVVRSSGFVHLVRSYLSYTCLCRGNNSDDNQDTTGFHRAFRERPIIAHPFLVYLLSCS